MINRRSRVGLLLVSLVLPLAGCSLLSAVGLAPTASTQVPIQLERCSNAPSALCLDSFGLGPGQLVITFDFPAAGSSEFYLKVWQGDTATTYPCTQAEATPTILYCTGPLMPLGTAVKIELFTKTGRVPLAQGEFALNGLGLPTAGPAGTALPGTAYPNQ